MIVARLTRMRFFTFGHLGVKSTGSERSSKVKKFLNGEERQRKTGARNFGWDIEDARSCKRAAKTMAPDSKVGELVGNIRNQQPYVIKKHRQQQA